MKTFRRPRPLSQEFNPYKVQERRIKNTPWKSIEKITKGQALLHQKTEALWAVLSAYAAEFKSLVEEAAENDMSTVKTLKSDVLPILKDFDTIDALLRRADKRITVFVKNHQKDV